MRHCQICLESVICCMANHVHTPSVAVSYCHHSNTRRV